MKHDIQHIKDKLYGLKLWCKVYDGVVVAISIWIALSLWTIWMVMR